jgi:rare lipoprotein A (peptidoglycan hydrolase)
MGGHALARRWACIARVGAVAVGCLALANCSGPLTSKEAKYSKRVVEEGEPVPKGGGTYRLGRPYTINGRTYVPHENPNYRAEGIASWYGSDFHGRLTANGEVYDMHGISAAHPTMPLPSYVRVTNLENGRSIVVRVNDRGPYAHERLIDLSIGTAKALKFYGNGLARRARRVYRSGANGRQRRPHVAGNAARWRTGTRALAGHDRGGQTFPSRLRGERGDAGAGRTAVHPRRPVRSARPSGGPRKRPNGHPGAGERGHGGKPPAGQVVGRGGGRSAGRVAGPWHRHRLCPNA